MPDLYAEIANIPPATQEKLADVLVLRANDPQMREMRQRYFAWLDVPKGGRGIEIGCGTGDVAHDLLESTVLGEVVGLDPSPVLIRRASEAFSGVGGLSFLDGDARNLSLENETFDLVVFHTTLCHIPGPDKALAEAFRILKPGGLIAVFDGDYATNTAALGPNDPLQACMEHFARNFIHDNWFCRTLPQRLRSAGFDIMRRDAHPYFAVNDPTYFLTLINRGADFMAEDGLINSEGCAALKAEAQSRAKNGTFFGFISFNTAIAQRPASASRRPWLASRGESPLRYSDT